MRADLSLYYSIGSSCEACSDACRPVQAFPTIMRDLIDSRCTDKQGMFSFRPDRQELDVMPEPVGADCRCVHYRPPSLVTCGRTQMPRG